MGGGALKFYPYEKKSFFFKIQAEGEGQNKFLGILPGVETICAPSNSFQQGLRGGGHKVLDPLFSHFVPPPRK